MAQQPASEQQVPVESTHLLVNEDVDIPSRIYEERSDSEIVEAAIQSFKDNKQRRWRTVFRLSSIACITIALFIAISGLFLFFYLGSLLISGIRDAVIITPYNADTYRIFSTTEDFEVVTYNVFRFFNLTNAYEVVSMGHKPRYVELPPVYYRKYINRFNITFSNDLDTVTFREQDYFVYDKNMSLGFDPKTAIVHNINPSYLAVLQATGGEYGLRKFMTGGAVEEIMKDLTTEFPAAVLDLNRPSALDDKVKACLANVTANEFYAIWSDAQQVPSELFKGMLLSEGSSQVANISVEVAAKLFSADVDYSLLDTNPTNSALWLNVSLGLKDSINQVVNLFGLTREQAAMIGQWLPKFINIYVWPAMQQQFIDPVTQKTLAQTYADLGWIQYAKGGVLPFGSVSDVSPMPGIPEIYYYADRILQITYEWNIDTLKRLFNSTSKFDKPIFREDYNMLYLKYYDAGDFATINSIWGLSQQEATIFGKYMYYLTGTFINDALQTQILSKDAGLVAKKSIDAWLFNYEDPLLALLQNPNAKNSTLLTNDTSIDEAYQHGEIKWNTGYYNLTFRGDYYKDNGMSEIPYWNKPMSVSGTDATAFAPGLSSKSEVTVWFPQTMRPEVFHVTDQVQHKGIECLRFTLKPEMIAVDPVFNNLYPGFSNMTAVGAPVFISKYYFLDSETSFWHDSVMGLKLPSASRDDIVVDVEPMTGTTMSAQKRIQLNVFLSNSSFIAANAQNMSLYYPNVPRGIMFPLALMEESAEITENLANEFISQVYFLYRVQYAIVWVSLGAAGLLSLVGFYLLYKSCSTTHTAAATSAHE